VIIEWQIHVKFAYQVHLLLKKRKATLSLQGISHLSIPAAIMYEGLPVVLIGQEVGEIGPIEQLTDKVQEQPYSLPKGLEWTCLNSETELLAELDELCQELNNRETDTIQLWLSFKHIQLHWNLLHPKIKLLGIRSSTTKKLMCLIWSIPCCVNIKGKSLALVDLATIENGFHNLQNLHMLYNIFTKEVMRQFKINRIHQAMFTPPPGIPSQIIQPVVTLSDWYYNYYDPLPYSTPQTVGLRKITSEDIPSALAVTNKYTSQFEIGRVFQSEEEFSHWFLSRSLPAEDVSCVTYVVEDPITGSITDMFSINLLALDKYGIGLVFAIVNTKTPAKQLIVDLLLCAKQEQPLINQVKTYQFGFRKEIFEKIFVLMSSTKYYVPVSMYNYNYPEVDEENFVLFTYT